MLRAVIRSSVFSYLVDYYVFGYEAVQYIIKIKIHSSCEIEDFVETHLCKLCVILRSRALRVVCPHIGRRLPLQLQCSYQGQQDDFSQSVRGNCILY